MDSSQFGEVRFEPQRPRLPRHLGKFLWQVLLMVGFRWIWGMLAFENQFWFAMLVVNLLGWMASYGWRPAIRQFKNWLEKISEE